MSLESANAILLTNPTQPGDPYSFDDYGVRPDYCIPPSLPEFEYSGMNAYDLQGMKVPPMEAERMRQEAELYHRMRLQA